MADNQTDDMYASIACPHDIVYVEGLYVAYAYICQTKGIVPLSFNEIVNHLRLIEYNSHRDKLIDYAQLASDIDTKRYPIIARPKFERIKFVGGTYDRYHGGNKYALGAYAPGQAGALTLFSSSDQSGWTVSNLSICVGLSTLIELLLVGRTIMSNYQTYTAYLLIARSGAIIILVSLSLLLVHISGVTKHLDQVLAYKLTSNASAHLHQWFGANVVFGALMHIVGHVGHVKHMLRVCIAGCTYTEVATLPERSLPLVISWDYFMKELAYYTGLLLTLLLLAILVSVVALQCKWMRPTSFYNQHRALSVLFAAGTVVHGWDQLLGFNLSYACVLPALICYVASRYTEISCQHQVEILDWHITASTIRLCLNNTHRLASQLEHGVALSAYVNHAPTARFEWHPFTITNSISKRESYISIKIAGQWTKQFVEHILKSNKTELLTIGHTVPSCFRFYKFYTSKIFFCSGIGITPFLTVIDDPFEYVHSNLLVWSVGSTELLKEFSTILTKLHAAPSLDILIFYSNSAAGIDQQIDVHQWSKFNFLQTLVHFYTRIDIIHGIQIPCIALLERANPWNIISQRIMQALPDIESIGIFVCGGEGYTNNVVRMANGLKNNGKKIRLDVWVEHM